MPMETITFDSLLTAVVVFLAICGAINVITATIKNIRELVGKPKATVKEMLDADKRRLDKHDKAIEALQDGQRVTCEGVQALLNHALHNGNSDEMQRASTDLNQWLINR